MEDAIEQQLETAAMLWRNLCLLGLQTSELYQATVAKTTIEIGPDMFLRGSNYKAQNLLVYFLLGRLDPGGIAKKFAGIWPILDHKQDQEFRGIALKLLTELERSGDLPRGTVQRSYLNFGFGPRLVNLLWWLSEYTLRQIFKSEFPERFSESIHALPNPMKMSAALLNAHISALEERCGAVIQNLFEDLSGSQTEVAETQSFISAITEDYRNAKIEFEQLERDAAEFERCNDHAEQFTEIANVQRCEAADRIEPYWAEMTQIHSARKEQYSMLDSIIAESSASLHHISKNDLLKLENSTSDSYEIDLVEKFNQFADSFMKIAESNFLISASEADQPSLDVSSDCSKIAQHVSMQNSQLQNIGELALEMSDVITSINSCVANLKQEVRKHDRLESEPSSTASSPDVNRLGLMPPTPQTSRPIRVPNTQTPSRSLKPRLESIAEEGAVKRIVFSASKPVRIRQPLKKCPLPPDGLLTPDRRDISRNR